MRGVFIVSLVVALAVCAASFPKFDHIFVILFENQGYTNVTRDPNFMYYAKLGVALKNYHATTHPSQPNYWSIVAGEYFNNHTNDNVDHDAPHLGDLLDAKGITWKTYQEGYPGNCFTGAVYGRYVRKHNPFISFVNMHSNAARCNAHIVNSTQLDIDLERNDLPGFSFYTPDLDNDGHDTGCTYAGNFLKTFMEARLGKFPPRTLIVISWDEDHYDEDNRILTTLLSLGNEIPSHAEDNTPYTHYTLLRTIQENWNLGSLNKNDAKANIFDEKAMHSLSGPAPPPLSRPQVPKSELPVAGMVVGFFLAFAITIGAGVGFMYKTEIKQWIQRMRGRGFERVGTTDADGDRFEAETMHPDVDIDLDDDDSLDQ